MKRRFTNESNLTFSYTTRYLFVTILTMLLDGMVGFWASAGFFMRAGLEGFGDMVPAGAGEGERTQFPSGSRGTPANS